MKITIHQPAGFNEAGGRSNNEDSIFPMPGTAGVADTLFLVCDGVGGEHKGEIASSVACQCLSHYLDQLKTPDLTLENVQLALEYTRQTFENIEKEDSDTHGMATTLTLLQICESGIAVAHLGDSRIYQVRNGKVIFQTKDHKWVNELVESGVITEEQARSHPKRNVITKVISAARNDQPDFRLIQDVKAGDYFFMCTDGVLEQLYNELLEYHLRDNPDNQASPAEIINAIKEECEGKTNDNFSAYLIRIDSSETLAAIVPEKTIKVNIAPPARQVTNHTHEKPKGMIYTIGLLAVVFIFAGGAFYFKSSQILSNPDTVVVSDSITTDAGTETKADDPIREEIVSDVKTGREGLEESAKELPKNTPGLKPEKTVSTEKKQEQNQEPKKHKDSTKARRFENEVTTKEDTVISDPRPAVSPDPKTPDISPDIKSNVVKTEIPVLPRKVQPSPKVE
jgi:protein phosphatase